jgi:hypothetical protein
MQNKLNQLRQQKSELKGEQEQRTNNLIDNRENSINDYMKEKINHYKELILRNQFLQSQIENLKINENQQIDLNNHLYQRNIQLIHLSYQDKINSIKNTFIQVRFYHQISSFQRNSNS